MQLQSFLNAAALTLAVAANLTASSNNSGAVELFPFEVPKNFSLFVGKDGVHHPVTTSVPEAQQYFDQGLTLVYAFNHDAAFWSFKKAAQLDPNLAMAYWGMALSLGTNINITVTSSREENAYALSQKALKLSSNASDSDKAYIQALVKRYSNDPKPDETALAENYYEAMQALTEQYPDDLDAATLFAESGMNLNPWSLWDENGQPREGTLKIVETLESVLKRNPNHLGANHYYIHAIEGSNNPERALMSAWRLNKVLPNLGHIVHMPSHIYLRVGDYHRAVEVNEKAAAADRAYINQYGLLGIYPLHYLSHNLAFLSYAASMEGRFAEAKSAADELTQFVAPHIAAMPNMEDYLPTSIILLARFHKWPEILQMPPFNPEWHMASAMQHFARGMAFAALGDISKAQEEQKLFQNSRKQIPPASKYGTNKPESIMAVADLVLQAKIADAQNNRDEAIKILQHAAVAQDNLDYNEPPDFQISTRDMLGALLLQEKRYAEAEKVFRKTLEKHPRYGKALFGLLESLKAQSRHADAFWINQEYVQAWQYSPTPLKISDL